MTKLSHIQLVILSAACQRLSQLALPLPARLTGGAAQKVVRALIAKGMLEEVQANRDAPTWRQAEDGRLFTLVATDAACATLGIEPDSASGGAQGAPADSQANEDAADPKEAPAARTAAPVRKARGGTKQAQLVAMLKRAEGATIAQIVEATGWQPHTVRGALAGALKKKLGLTVTSERVEGIRVYRIV